MTATSNPENAVGQISAEQLFESSVDCFKLLDSEGRLTQMNSYGQCLMEVDDFQAIQGLEWSELWPEASRKTVRQELEKALSGGIGQFTGFCPTAKGTPKTWDVRVTPVMAGDGSLLGVLAVSRDITALKESELKFRTMANAMPQMVWSTLPDGYADYYNDRWYEFTGTPKGSTDGEAWKGMFHPADQERTTEVWSHSLRTGETYEIEYRLRHHTGGYRWVLGRALPVKDDSGRIVRWMGTCTDIHEQRQAQEDLLESHRRKDEFLAMLAHELRNPLAPITAAAEMLRMGKADEARVKKMSEVISRQARHMTGLIEDLLDVSRVTRGKISLESANLELRAIVSEAVEQVRPAADAHRHQLHIDAPPPGTQVMGDKKRLVQVLSNVLNNAIKYTPSGGGIFLSTREKGGQVPTCQSETTALGCRQTLPSARLSSSYKERGRQTVPKEAWELDWL